MYSFSLDPKKHQPTGTCNFSKLDSAKLVFETIILLIMIYMYIAKIITF